MGLQFLIDILAHPAKAGRMKAARLTAQGKAAIGQ
jgi:hypothetical protein